MSFKSASIHRPLQIDRAKYPDNPSIEVTVVVAEQGGEEKALYFTFLRATPVGFLYSNLREHKDGDKIAGKELQFNGKAVPSGTDITFESFLDSSDWIVHFYIIPQDAVLSVKQEDHDEDTEEHDTNATSATKPDDSYGLVGESASQQLEISLHDTIVDKLLPVKEAVVKEALSLTAILKALLQQCVISENDEAEIRKVRGFTEKLEEIATHAITPPTIVGIMGTTGSGKSSLMNAMFGSQLFPVSGTRACTAAITEISYNPGDIPYRAVIDFVSLEAWRAELDLLRQDTEMAKDPDAEDE